MFRKMLKVLFLPAVPQLPAEIMNIKFDVTNNVMSTNYSQRGYPADWLGALTRGADVSGKVTRVALNQNPPMMYMDMSFYMKYAV